MKKNLTIIFLLLCSVMSFAQSAGRALSKGNEGYENKHFTSAEASYRIANSKQPLSATPDYNMGNAMVKQKQFKEAESAYNRAVNKASTKEERHQAYHNLGNAYMAQKRYKEAENAYKNALRNNPKDKQTRYNYAVAKQLNEQNPENEDKNEDKEDQDNQEQKDQEQQDQEQQQDQKDNPDGNKDNQEQNKDTKDNQEKEKPQEAPQPEMSKDQMDNILKSLERDEKNVQQRLIDKGKGQYGADSLKTGVGQRKKDW